MTLKRRWRSHHSPIKPAVNRPSTWQHALERARLPSGGVSKCSLRVFSGGLSSGAGQRFVRTRYVLYVRLLQGEETSERHVQASPSQKASGQRVDSRPVLWGCGIVSIVCDILLGSIPTLISRFLGSIAVGDFWPRRADHNSILGGWWFANISRKNLNSSVGIVPKQIDQSDTLSINLMLFWK